MSNSLIPEFVDSENKLNTVYKSLTNLKILLSEIESDAVSIMNANAANNTLIQFPLNRKEMQLQVYLSKVQNIVNDIDTLMDTAITLVSQV